MTQAHQSSLDAFLIEANRARPDPVVLGRQLAQVVLDLSSSGLPPGTVEQLIECVNEICQIADVEHRAWEDFYLPRDQGFVHESAKRRAMIEARVRHLSRYLAIMGTTAHRPDGYVAQDLRRQAEIGHELWRKIVSTSGIGASAPGDQHRRFSAANVRRLAHAAEQAGTPKARRAAIAWRELIGETAAPHGPSRPGMAGGA